MEQYLMENQWIIWLALLWTLAWKGVALWKATKNNHKKWFIALLLLNTLAILEIVYIFYFSKEKQPK
jgi:membrane protein DedA with SNARE-associated domain